MGTGLMGSIKWRKIARKPMRRNESQNAQNSGFIGPLRQRFKIDLWAEKSKQESEQDTKNSKEL